MKSYGATVQMKPLQQYFYMVPFVFQYFTKSKIRIFLEFCCLALLRVKGLKGGRIGRWGTPLSDLKGAVQLERV